MKHLFKNILSIILILLSVACKKERYNYVSYFDADKQNVKVKGNFVDSLEQGKWYYYSPKGDIIENGNFNNGLKVGEWKMRTTSSDEYAINWTVYSDSNSMVNIPEEWRVVPNKDYILYAKTSLKDKDRHFFSITEYNTSNIGLSLTEFKDNYFKGLKRNSSIKNYYTDKYVIGGNTIYLSQYNTIIDSSKFLLFNGLIEIDNKIYDFLYSSYFEGDLEVKYNMFTSILTGTFIKNKRLISTIREFESVERVGEMSE